MYETEKESKNLKFGKNFYLPIGVTKITNLEEYEEEKEYSLEEARNIAIESLSERIEEKIENKENISDKIIKTKQNSDYIEVFMTYEVIEIIGEDKKIN